MLTLLKNLLKKKEVVSTGTVEPAINQLLNIILASTYDDYIKWIDRGTTQESLYNNSRIVFCFGIRQLNVNEHVFYLSNKMNSTLGFAIRRNLDRQLDISTEQLAQKALQELTNDTSNTTVGNW